MEYEFKNSPPRNSISISASAMDALNKTRAKIEDMTGVKCSMSKVIEYLLAVESGKVTAFK
jgi:hypothetical protein